MTRDRLTYGQRAACRHCGQDIEWTGRVHRSDMPSGFSGGWRDRGGNRGCAGYWSDDGEWMKRATKHNREG